jgi:hypothetical protein
VQGGEIKDNRNDICGYLYAYLSRIEHLQIYQASSKSKSGKSIEAPRLRGAFVVTLQGKRGNVYVSYRINLNNRYAIRKMAGMA